MQIPQTTDRGFSSRVQKHNAFLLRLMADLKAMGFEAIIHGWEQTHAEFLDVLHQSSDLTSREIRFAPDILACVNPRRQSLYVEPKTGKNIEKDAYQEYLKFAQRGHIVALVYEIDGSWAWSFVEDLHLMDGNLTVSSFSEERRFPVDADGWIHPRQSSHWGTTKWEAIQASGTAYREVNLNLLRARDDFKPEILNRLATQVIIDEPEFPGARPRQYRCTANTIQLSFNFWKS